MILISNGVMPVCYLFIIYLLIQCDFSSCFTGNTHRQCRLTSTLNAVPKLDREIALKSLSTVYFSSLLAVLPFALVLVNDEQSIDQKLHSHLFNYIQKGDNVLEVGFGSDFGANFPYYPSDISLTGLDPAIKEENNRIIKEKYASKGVDLKSLIRGKAESMPFDSGSFDVVVSTLVFCTLQDPIKSMNEIHRVLKRGGIFLSVEHIFAEDDKFLSKTQELFDPLQQVVADGCHLTRRTDQLFLSFISSNSSRQENSFSELIESKYVTLKSQWPISRQVISVIRK